MGTGERQLARVMAENAKLERRVDRQRSASQRAQTGGRLVRIGGATVVSYATGRAIGRGLVKPEHAVGGLVVGGGVTMALSDDEILSAGGEAALTSGLCIGGVTRGMADGAEDVMKAAASQSATA